MHLRLFYIFFLLSLTAIAQPQNDLAIEAIRQTLPEFLDDNPNSAFSYMKGGTMYARTKSMLEKLLMISADQQDRAKIKSNLAQLDKTADSLALVLNEKKVKVFVDDQLHGYRYPQGEENWGADYNAMLDDFETNSSHRFNAPVDTAYIGLIRKQIFTKPATVKLHLAKLENPRYEFTNDSTALHDPICIKGYKLYQPVFNSEKTMGCYLFSAACNDGYCRDSIFIRLENGKWRYVDNYPSHLVDGVIEE